MSTELPRIALKATYKEETSIGDLSLLSLGYGLHQIWVYAAIFSAQPFFGKTFIIATETNTATNVYPVFLISIVALVATLFFAALTDQKFLKFYVSKRFLCIGVTLCVLGTAVSFLDFTTAVGPFLVAFAGIATGIGSATTTLFWGTAFSRCSNMTIIANAACSIIVMSLGYMILLHFPYPIAGIFVCLVPLAEIAILWNRVPRKTFAQEQREPEFIPISSEKRTGFFLSFGFTMALFGFALGYLREAFTDAAVNATDTTEQFVLLVSGIIAGVIIMAIALFMGSQKKESWHQYFKVIVPVAVIAIIFSTTFYTGADSLSTGILVIAYFCFEITFLIMFAEIAHSYRISPILVFGLGRSALGITSTVIAFAPIAARSIPTPFGDPDYAIVALVVICLIAGISILPAQDVSEAPRSDEEEEGEARVPVQPQAATQAGVIDIPQEQKPAVPAVASTDKIQANCRLVADHYLLSQRESEVLYLLAIGRNSGYIQKTLYISEGTAKTHIRHIYRKLNVHKQQELMTIVETADQQLT